MPLVLGTKFPHYDTERLKWETLNTSDWGDVQLDFEDLQGTAPEKPPKHWKRICTFADRSVCLSDSKCNILRYISVKLAIKLSHFSLFFPSDWNQIPSDPSKVPNFGKLSEIWSMNGPRYMDPPSPWHGWRWNRIQLWEATTAYFFGRQRKVPLVVEAI